MHRMLLSSPDKAGLEPIKQVHDIGVWQKIVGGPIAIVPLTAEGLAVVVNRQPPASLRQSIMIPLQHYKKYNMWGKYFFVKYHQGEVVDLKDADIFELKGLLGDPIPIELSVDLAAALGFKPLCQYEGCGFMEEHPAHDNCKNVDCGGDELNHSEKCLYMWELTMEKADWPVYEGIRLHKFVKPESIEVETVSEVEAAKLAAQQQSETADSSPTSGVVLP